MGQKIFYYSGNREKVTEIYSKEHIEPDKDLKPFYKHQHLRKTDQILVECSFNTINNKFTIAQPVSVRIRYF